MSVKIYTVHDAVPQWFWATEVWIPFLVGEIGEGALDPVFQTDREAPTLSDHHSFGEMRAHYWVWKHMAGVYRANMAVDYVGFQPYDRTFVSELIGGGFPEVRAHRETFLRRDLALTTRWITGLVDHCDIIVPRKWPADLDTAADWQVLVSALNDANGPSSDLAVGIDYLYRANMFVMRADLFDAYMTWWDRVMTQVATFTAPPAEGDQSRSFGAMSERLLTMWVAQQRRSRPELRILELPLMVGDFTVI